MSPRSRRRDERGAVLVIFAAFVIVAVLMLAFVIDIGGLRQEKKEVTLSTDAAALAVAAQLDLRTFAPGDYECDEVPVVREDVDDPFLYADSVALEYLERNGETVADGCRVRVTGPRRGYVVIGGLEDVEYAFSGVVGQQSGRVHGVSASVARVDSGGGLRPIGLCATETTINSAPDGEPYDLSEDLLNASKGDDGTLDVAVDAVIALEHLDRDSGCEVTASGQRGQLNLDPSQNGNGGNNRCVDPDPDPEDADEGYFSSEYRYGYYGELTEWVGSDGGMDFSTLQSCFDRDISEEQLIWLPIFDNYQPPPDPKFRLVAFAQAQLTGYCISNAQYYAVPASIGCRADVPGDSQDKPWLRMTITRVVDFDEAGPPLTDDALRDRPAICAVRDEATQLANCVPPNPPARGTPSDPSPPPASQCRATAVSASPDPLEVGRQGSGSKNLSAEVRLSVTVEDISRCSALQAVFRSTVQANQINSNTEREVVGSTISLIFEQGTGDFRGAGSAPYFWNLELDSDGPVTYPSSPIELRVN